MGFRYGYIGELRRFDGEFQEEDQGNKIDGCRSGAGSS